VTWRFATEHHESARLDDGSPIFGGYFPTGGMALPIPDLDVPVIVPIAEAEMLTDDAHWAQIRAWHVANDPEARATDWHRDLDLMIPSSPVSHRRPDGDLFRLYEIAGMPHTGTRGMSRATQVMSDVVGPDYRLPDGVEFSQFPRSQILHMLLDNLIGWANKRTTPPPSMLIELDSNGSMRRDRHGNALGGLRTVYLDVPTCTAIPWPAGEMFQRYPGQQADFPRELLIELYGTHDVYLERAEARLRELIDQGLYLEGDAEDLLAEARSFKTRFA